MKIAKRHWLWIGGVAGMVAAALVALLAPVHDWLDAFEDLLERMGLVRGLLVFGVVSAIGTMAFVPAWIFPIAAGAVFGFAWGLAAALAASVAASLAAFLVGRYVIHDRIGRAARRDPSFAAVDAAVARNPFKVVALLRLSPVFPSALKSYFLGLTRIDAIAYITGSALGMLPGLAVKVYLGHAGRGALATGGPTKWMLLAMGLAATAAMAVVVGRAARKRLGLAA
jgi:uncharacterized membrane protein YdjX (TVP38/TMEM64 family)